MRQVSAGRQNAPDMIDLRSDTATRPRGPQPAGRVRAGAAAGRKAANRPAPALALEIRNNGAGGRVGPRAELEPFVAGAGEVGLAVLLAGARLLNAAVAQGVHPS